MRFVALSVLGVGPLGEPVGVDEVEALGQPGPSLPDRGDVGCRGLHEVLVDAAVSVGCEQHGRAGGGAGPVASAAGGPARLLHVLLDGGRHLEMHDQLDVRLVDAESKALVATTTSISP